MASAIEKAAEVLASRISSITGQRAGIVWGASTPAEKKPYLDLTAAMFDAVGIKDAPINAPPAVDANHATTEQPVTDTTVADTEQPKAEKKGFFGRKK